MTLIRDEMANKAVNKTVTVPKWLCDLAEEKRVNFSRVLQTALKSHLGIDGPMRGMESTPAYGRKARAAADDGKVKATRRGKGPTSI